MWDMIGGIGKAIVNSAKSFIGGPAGAIVHVASTAFDMRSQNEDVADDYEDLQIAQMKLQYLQHQDNIKLQSQLAQVNHEKAKEIQHYIQSAENARLEKKLDFEKWRFQEEKALQLQVLELNHRLQTQVLSYQRQTSLKVLEEQKKLDNSPIWLVTSDIITNTNPSKITPLRIFFAPPKLQFESLQNKNNPHDNLPNLELTIAEGLRQFLQNYTTYEQQIDFLAGAWTSKSFHSEASIKSLFSVLKTEPTLVLESEIDGDYLNFRIAQWFKNGANYNYRPIISRLSYQEILFNSAKERALEWEKTRNQLIELGETPADVDLVYGGDNVQNLATLKKAEKFKLAGINTVNLTYLVNKKDYENLAQFLIIYHSIFTGLVADEYFIREYQLTPLLPTFIPDLIKEIKEGDLLTEIMESVKVYYDQLYESLAEIYGVLLPDLLLDFALNLAQISQADWAKSQVINSLKLWLKQRYLLDNEVTSDVSINDLLSMIEDNLIFSDQEYINKLNQLLTILGYEDSMKVTFNVSEPVIIEELEIEEEVEEIPPKSQEEIDKEIIIPYLEGLNVIRKLGISSPININMSVIRSRETTISSDHKYFVVQFKGFYLRPLFKKPSPCLCTQTYDFNSGKFTEDINLSEVLASFNESVDKYFPNINQGNSRIFSPDSKTLFGVKEYLIIQWDINTKEEIRTFSDHKSNIITIAIHPEGKILACSYGDKTVKFWYIPTGEELHSINEEVRVMSFSSDGQTFATLNNNTAKLWRSL